MSIGIYNYNIILSSFKGTVFPSTLLNCFFLPLFTVGRLQKNSVKQKIELQFTSINFKPLSETGKPMQLTILDHVSILKLFSRITGVCKKSFRPFLIFIGTSYFHLIYLEYFWINLEGEEKPRHSDISG